VKGYDVPVTRAIGSFYVQRLTTGQYRQQMYGNDEYAMVERWLVVSFTIVLLCVSIKVSLQRLSQCVKTNVAEES